MKDSGIPMKELEGLGGDLGEQRRWLENLKWNWGLRKDWDGLVC